MTAKEALDVLINKIQIDVRCTDDFERDNNCLYRCKVALEKEIAQKPIIEHDAITGEKTYFCPRCRGINISTDCGDPFYDMTLNFCDDCGQAIDWSGI